MNKLGILVASYLVILANPSIAAEAHCKPVNVAQIDTRVHIQCDAPILDDGKSILWFALPTVDAEGNTNDIMRDNAARFMSMGMAAIAADKVMRFWYVSNDTSGSVYGCGANDCRKPTGFFIIK